MYRKHDAGNWLVSSASAALGQQQSTLPDQHPRPSGVLCCWPDVLKVSGRYIYPIYTGDGRYTYRAGGVGVHVVASRRSFVSGLLSYNV